MKISKTEAAYCYAMAVIFLIFAIAMTVTAVVKAANLIWYGESQRCESLNYINYGVEPVQEESEELTK